MSSDLRGLIETTRALPRSMQRNRHCEVRARERRLSVHGKQPRQRMRQRSSLAVLERVNDSAERSIVLADGPATRHSMRSAATT